jgi:Protein of unknown function (DUF3891)
MLLCSDGDDLIAVGQPAHAWVSGQLARAWGNGRFGTLEPREEVCLAAEQHDAGMAAWEGRPTLNPKTGLPRSFMELTLDEHLEIWWSAAPLVLSQSPYAALLVSMHGTALYERRDLERLTAADAERVKAFLAGQRALQEQLRERLDADTAQVHRNQRLIWTWDSLSLGLLLGWAPFTLAQVPTTDGATDVEVTAGSLDPWPFATPEVTLRYDGRPLAGPYADEETMRAALATAPWLACSVTLTACTR